MNAMVQAQSKKKALKRGQGMTEYIIIVALIAIAAIGVVTLFGDNIRKLFGASANALSGSTSEANAGQKAQDKVLNKTMRNFGQGNNPY
jgi:pilus assembly protein Flp/PilA